MVTSITDLQNKYSGLSSTLSKSNTAYAPNTLPTSSDISIARQKSSLAKQIDDMRSKQLRNQWYGANSTTPEPEDTSTQDSGIMGALRNLSKPLNAIAGTAQYMLGKGTEPTWAGNVNKAIDTNVTFGNILQQEGAPRWLQIPLGFALDVAFDPVNWATAGTAALIPRTIGGFVKGGFKEGALRGAAELTAQKAATGIAEEVAPGLLGGIKNSFKGTKDIVSSGWSPAKAWEAGTTGLTSNLAKKAATVMKAVPFASKIPGYAETVAKLGTKAVLGAEKYDTLMGSNVIDKLGKGFMGIPAGSVGTSIKNLVTGETKIPGLGILGKVTDSGQTVGEKIYKFFEYSPAKQVEVAKTHGMVTSLYKDKNLIMVGSPEGADIVNISDLLKPNSTITIDDATHELANLAVKDASGALKLGITDAKGALIPEVAGQIKVYDSLDNAKEMLDLAGKQYSMEHLVEAYKITEPGKTGVQWYDDFITKAKATTYRDMGNFAKTKMGMVPTPVEIEREAQTGAENLVKFWNSQNTVKENVVGIGERIAQSVKGIKDISPGEWKPYSLMLNGLEAWTSIMKGAKTAMSLGGLVVNTIGNFFMGPMMGIPTYKGAYLKELLNAKNLLNNKITAADFKSMFFSDFNSFFDIMEKDPDLFRQGFGIDVRDISGKLGLEGKMASFVGGESRAEMKKVLEDIFNSLDSAAVDAKRYADEAIKIESTLSPIEKSRIKKVVGGYKTSAETAREMSKRGATIEAQKGSAFTENELNNTTFDKLRGALQDKVDKDPQNIAAQFLNLVVNKMPRMYEQTDQIQKIATINYLTKVGITEQELLTMSKNIKIIESDLVTMDSAGKLLPPKIVNGEKVFLLKPEKAIEAALEAFMNYSAMPDFVKVMKALPVAGAPFLSFQYAMAAKMGKTLVNNPAIFNKIGYLLNEISGARSPEEKLAMEQAYNTYLKSPTVVKVFGMVNTDVKQWISIYSMNMFNPSQRKYDNSAQGKFLKALDNFPIFQDPAGQILKDYWIQPMILSGTNQASQGSFGQPLLPNYDADGKLISPTLGTRSFYAGRNALESFVPGTLAYLGLFGGGLSPETIEWIPSYRARQLALAETGKSSIGATTKENALVKTLRAIFGTAGIPIQILDTTQLPSKLPPSIK